MSITTMKAIAITVAWTIAACSYFWAAQDSPTKQAILYPIAAAIFSIYIFL